MQSIRFEDGEAYERGMSPWSRLAGQMFLKWLAPPAGLRWLDVGCGTGRHALRLAAAGAQVTAVDFSKQSENAQARHAKAKAEKMTCIECHFGVAHTEPDGPGPKELKAGMK